LIGLAARIAIALGLAAGLVGAVIAVDAARHDIPARAHLNPAVVATPTPAGTLRSPASAPSPAATAGTPTSQTYPFRPTGLTLASGATAPVDPAGVGADGALEVPADPSRVGWWDGGALVGEPFGSVVLAGHLDSLRYGMGVLVELRNLRIGDVVLVTGPGRSQRFRVTETWAVPKAQLGTTAEAFRQDIPNRLVLITCAGPYDHVAHAYPDNLVVVATPIA
jgi:hypothetical protein